MPISRTSSRTSSALQVRLRSRSSDRRELSARTLLNLRPAPNLYNSQPPRVAYLKGMRTLLDRFPFANWMQRHGLATIIAVVALGAGGIHAQTPSPTQPTSGQASGQTSDQGAR